MKLEKGLVQVYFGEGKGKTSAAVGVAFRAAGYGLRSYVIQFMKKSQVGEMKAAEKLRPLVEIEQFGRDVFVTADAITQEDKNLANAGLEKARRLLKDSQHDLIILDEINVALYYKLVSLEDMVDIIKHKPDEVELILTGRWAPKQVIELADLATEMVEVKHPYRDGIKARKGIDY